MGNFFLGGGLIFTKGFTKLYILNEMGEFYPDAVINNYYK